MRTRCGKLRRSRPDPRGGREIVRADRLKRISALGADALKLKRGELALVLDGARVRVVEVRRAPQMATG